jgi:large subunit ribosomal protein L6
MSRIGKLPVSIPGGVTITVDGSEIKVDGPKGNLSEKLLATVTVKVEDSQAIVTRKDESKRAKSEHGLIRSLVANMVKGVTEGFEKKLEVNGVGFKVNAKGPRELQMSLGYSHPVNYKTDYDVNLGVAKNVITVTGASKQQVGQVAADIKSLRKPDPYKAKGIKYVDEQLIRKAGKAGAK